MDSESNGHALATDLSPFPKPGARTVWCVVEATRGTRSKFKYDPERGLFKLHRLVPSGLSFPLDFGFIPGTLGEDGDPLDVLVLADEPLPVGVLTEARLVGVIEAIQREEGEAERNDRLVAVAAESLEYEEVRTLRDVGAGLVESTETFFTAYNALDDIEFTARAAKGTEAAFRLFRQGRDLYERKHGTARQPRRSRSAGRSRASRVNSRA